jgi:hypothetical protein
VQCSIAVRNHGSLFGTKERSPCREQMMDGSCI